MIGYAIVVGSILDKAEPTWHRPVYRTRPQRVWTLCGIEVATVTRKRGKPIVDARRHSVIRQDHAEKIGRQCSRCAARHEEARRDV